jgi:hypothetical protein
MAQNAKEDVRESEDAITQYRKDIADLQSQREEIVSEISDRWGRIVSDTTEVAINPKKTDVYVNIFGIAWKPFYIIQAGGETTELAAFGSE